MMFHNTEKTETRHRHAPQIFFSARATTPKSLLQSVVSVVKFIAEQGLTFRDVENDGSPRKFFQTKFQKKVKRCFW